MTFNRVLAVFLIVFVFTSMPAAGGENKRYVGEPEWDHFSRFVEEQDDRDRRQGTAYMVSGALAVIGGTIGYQQTQDPFARTVFTISQSMGIAAIGYGAYMLEVGHEDGAFYRAVDRTPGLSPAQKNGLLANYLAEKNANQKKAKLIKAFTHGFIAALNFYNGSKQTDSNLQSVHYFIGGLNLVAAVSFSF